MNALFSKQPRLRCRSRNICEDDVVLYMRACVRACGRVTVASLSPASSTSSTSSTSAAAAAVPGSSGAPRRSRFPQRLSTAASNHPTPARGGERRALTAQGGAWRCVPGRAGRGRVCLGRGAREGRFSMDDSLWFDARSSQSETEAARATCHLPRSSVAGSAMASRVPAHVRQGSRHVGEPGAEVRGQRSGGCSGKPKSKSSVSARSGSISLTFTEITRITCSELL